MPLSGNRGEWSEIYIFLKLIEDGKIYAADRNMNKILTVFLNILKIIREENRGQRIDYMVGDQQVQIFLNDADHGPTLDRTEYGNWRREVWEMLSNADRGNGLSSETIEQFLSSIHIAKLKAPAFSQAAYFGGTQDITMQVQDYRSGVTSIIGFSCKSDFSGKATLFNASKENTNFIFRITGDMTDEIMDQFNDTWSYRRKRNRDTGEYELSQVVATKERIQLLKNAGCDVEYYDMAVESAKRNLILSGGRELPQIVGNMLKYYYFVGENQVTYSPLNKALNYVVENDVAEYGFADLESIYRRKIGSLLYDMFTGMRLSTAWDGRSSVNGGYIVAKEDGDVVAYHSCMADEFKDFLIEQLGFETPSASRHNFLSIYKENDEYFIKFNLQVRFKGIVQDTEEE